MHSEAMVAMVAMVEGEEVAERIILEQHFYMLNSTSFLAGVYVWAY